MTALLVVALAFSIIGLVHEVRISRLEDRVRALEDRNPVNLTRRRRPPYV